MKSINYEALLAKHKPKGFVGDDANRIANTLISDNCVQAGNGLARLLEVDSCFDNHMAVRVWVQRYLDAQDGYVVDEICSRLQGKLYELFATISYGL